MKARLAELSAARGAIVLNADDPGCRELGARLERRPALVRHREPRPRGHRGRWHPRPRRRAAPAGRRGARCPASPCSTTSLAAALGAHLAGAPRTAIADAIRDFHGVAHRLQTVGDRGGVTFVNDSMATIPVAAEAALAAVRGARRHAYRRRAGEGTRLRRRGRCDRRSLPDGDPDRRDGRRARGGHRRSRAGPSRLVDGRGSPCRRGRCRAGRRRPPRAGSRELRHVHRLRCARRRVRRGRRGHRPVAWDRLDDRPGRRRARPRPFARRRAPRAWTGVVPAHAGRARAGGDRRRDGVLRVERAGVSRQRRPCRPGAPAGAVGRVGDRLPLPVQPRRLPPPPAPGHAGLLPQPGRARRGPDRGHRGVRQSSVVRHPRRRLAPAGRGRQARHRPLPGALARPPRDRGPQLLERARAIRAARGTRLPAHRPRARPRHRRRLRGGRALDLLHGRREPRAPDDDRLGGRRGRHRLHHHQRLPAQPGADVPRPLPRPAPRPATTRSRG